MVHVYGAANRLSAVKQGGTVTMYYGYNGRGERVHRHLGSDVTYSVYDEAGHWVGDYDASGAPKQQAIWPDDLPMGLLDAIATAANRLLCIEYDRCLSKGWRRDCRSTSRSDIKHEPSDLGRHRKDQERRAVGDVRRKHGGCLRHQGGGNHRASQKVRQHDRIDLVSHRARRWQCDRSP
ncbi:hypothetical protein [Marilutibacter maris]|uniref:hypothetical protein n=1 Tax=Marilutibacter maris TaxID=1605891 RepID=UPI0011AE522C|nr:hypothetical protein [Lysobacter maris]